MVKDQKPAEELSGIAKQSIEQARGAVDIYFDTLKKAVSSEWPNVRLQSSRGQDAAS
jgi:hypothetical protein